MLDLGVVPHILTMLEQHVDEGDVSVQHAGLSALRNLAIPGTGQGGAAPSQQPCYVQLSKRSRRPTPKTNVARFGRTWRHEGSSSHDFCISATNKVRMLDDGVTDRIKTLLRSDMPPVQFKLLGTLRMMVDGQGKCCCFTVSHIDVKLFMYKPDT